MSRGVAVISVQVGPARGGQPFVATTDVGGTPITTYGATEAEAERRARGAALRCLGGLLERGQATVESVSFKTTRA